jgi:hydrogenase nickel incorporation protein HypA/HybF
MFFNAMHELSIALGIVKIAEDETKKAAAKTVTKITLEIGVLAGIEIDALNFVWEAAVENTVLEKAQKTIQLIDGKGKCIDCDTLFKMDTIYDCCPNCGSNFKGILQGKELKVKTLEVI